MIKSYLDFIKESVGRFILEHKFWGKSIPDFLNYIEDRNKKTFIFIDTETTGLRDVPYEVQLTQVSAVACSLNGYNFKEISTFNKKIELTKNTKDNMSDDIERVLKFNHYYGDSDLYEEEDVLRDFKKFIDGFNEVIFVIQNAEFDMSFLNTRSDVRFKNEIIDTKQILQLFVIPLYEKLAESDDIYIDILNKIGTSQRDYGLVSSSLGKWAPHFGIDASAYHDALFDCRMTIELFDKILETLNLNKNVDILKYQSKRIKIIK